LSEIEREKHEHRTRSNKNRTVSKIRVIRSPLLSIWRTTTNTVVVSWPSPSTGWTLQQNTNSVSSVNWCNVTSGIQDNGATKSLIVSPPVGNRFYRMYKP